MDYILLNPQIEWMSKYRELIPPYVRNGKFKDIETATQVADKALDICTKINTNYKIGVNIGPVVALAAIATGNATPENVNNIYKCCGITMKTFLNQIAEARQLLNIPIPISFSSLAEEMKIPQKYAKTAEKLYKDLVAHDPNDLALGKPSVQAGCLLVISVARGLPKDQILQKLAALCYVNAQDIVGAEKMIKDFAGENYGLKPKKITDTVVEEAIVEHGVPEEIKKEVSAHIEQLKKEATKKKRQLTLNFGKK